MATMVRTFKYRLYPTRSQETKLQESLDVCRELYNSLLHDRKFCYEVYGKAPTEREQEKKLTGFKADHPELCTVHAHVLQNVALRVDVAYNSYFSRLEDYQYRKGKGRLKQDRRAGISTAFEEKCPQPPREKGRGSYDSLTWKEYGNGNNVEADSVFLSKIGTLKAILHRPLSGTPKTTTVRRQNGKWFACVSCIVEAELLPVSEEEVGIDVGLEKFAALSTGEFIENPRFFRKEQKALAKAQRKLEKVKNKHKRGGDTRSPIKSKARKKAKKVVTRTHERIRNKRHNFHHQTALKLVDRFGTIAVEELNIVNMSASPAPKPDPEKPGQFLPNGHAAKAGLNKSILDAGWYTFRRIEAPGFIQGSSHAQAR